MGAEVRNCLLEDLEPGFRAEGQEFALVGDALY